MKGCTHIYFGDGKGKTTAAMGLAIRAAGNDKKVFIIQFLKGGPTGELKILLQQPNITILRGKPNTPFTWNMTEEQKERGHCISNTAIKTSHTPCTKQSMRFADFRRNYGKL